MLAQVDPEYLKQRPRNALRRLISRAFFEGRPLTTRGRWLNPFVFAHFALEKRLPQLRRIERPLFIIGTGRSGTTILGALLSLHPDVAMINEAKALWHAVFPYEDVNGNYSNGPARFRLDAHDASVTVQRHAHRLFGAYLRATFARRLVDKEPELVFRIPFVRALFPDARFIFIVRNGWNTAYSIQQWSQREAVRAEDTLQDWWGDNRRKWRLLVEELVLPDPYFAPIHDVVMNLDDQLDMAIVEWTVTMREGLRQIDTAGRSICLVRYEELTQRPEAVLHTVLDFAGLPHDETLMQYATARLQPAPDYDYPQSAIHPALRPLFTETAAALGYGAAQVIKVP